MNGQQEVVEEIDAVDLGDAAFESAKKFDTTQVSTPAVAVAETATTPTDLAPIVDVGTATLSNSPTPSAHRLSFAGSVSDVQASTEVESISPRLNRPFMGGANYAPSDEDTELAADALAATTVKQKTTLNVKANTLRGYFSAEALNVATQNQNIAINAGKALQSKTVKLIEELAANAAKNDAIATIVSEKYMPTIKMVRGAGSRLELDGIIVVDNVIVIEHLGFMRRMCTDETYARNLDKFAQARNNVINALIDKAFDAHFGEDKIIIELFSRQGVMQPELPIFSKSEIVSMRKYFESVGFEVTIEDDMILRNVAR